MSFAASETSGGRDLRPPCCRMDWTATFIAAAALRRTDYPLDGIDLFGRRSSAISIGE